MSRYKHLKTLQQRADELEHVLAGAHARMDDLGYPRARQTMTDYTPSHEETSAGSCWSYPQHEHSRMT